MHTPLDHLTYLFVVCYLDLWCLGLFKETLHVKCSLRAEQEEQALARRYCLCSARLLQ